MASISRPMEGYTETNPPERSAPASQMDYGHSNLQKLSDWEPAAHPVPDATLDGRPMEGTTNLEHSVRWSLWTVDSRRGC